MADVRRFWNRRVGLGVLLLGVAVAIAATRVTSLQGRVPEGTARNEPAPEFRGISGWLNSAALSVRGLRGDVVLVDFWAYSCVNCVRTFPALRQMYARYHPFGLEIVGVHSPEFEFEKQASNVRDAIERNDLPWPTALDNEMETWRAYRNHYWPHVYLIDAQGRLRFDHIGEGGEDLIQRQIRNLLAETGVSLPAPIDFSEGSLNPHITPEIYAGSLRGAPSGSLGNQEGFRLDRVVDYEPVAGPAIEAAGTDGIFFVAGRWRAREEYLEAAEDGARVQLRFLAKDVFFVASAGGGGPAGVRLTLDGKPVPADALGADARGGVVTVSRSDLYRVLALPSSGEHQLTLEVDAGFRLYTFTFG
jgi:thiol-disulfide isomerase/thioredoxin